MTTPSPSELDIYINSIVDNVRKTWQFCSTNRLKSTVRFYYGMRQLDYFVEIPYTELKECMENKTLPKEIQKLL